MGLVWGCGEAAGSHGPALSPDWRIHGSQDNALFGHALAWADVDGDGHDDLIVGASHHDTDISNSGRVDLYRGSEDGLANTSSWSASGERAGALFGSAVASAGDVNGDGYEDVIIGAELDGIERIEEGRVFLFLGSAAGLEETPHWTAEGDQAYAEFGVSVGSAGDVNGDGYDDIIAGAWLHDGEHVDEGQARVYLGGASGPDREADWQARGDQERARFGSAVAAAGDVNGDGYGDVIIGARGYDNGQADEGRAYLFLGSASGLERTPSWIAESDRGGALFGASVSSAGDVNGDGYDDVVVGAIGYKRGGFRTGGVFIYLGGEDGLGAKAAWTDGGLHQHGVFGAAVAPAGDVNGDGYDDILVGAPEDEQGYVVLYLGSPEGPIPSRRLTGERAGATGFGVSLAGAGDVNGDGLPDLVVGADRSVTNGHLAGGALIYLGASQRAPRGIARP